LSPEFHTFLPPYLPSGWFISLIFPFPLRCFFLYSLIFVLLSYFFLLRYFDYLSANFPSEFLYLPCFSFFIGLHLFPPFSLTYYTNLVSIPHILFFSLAVRISISFRPHFFPDHSSILLQGIKHYIHFVIV
jgi:hypothetical protein